MLFLALQPCFFAGVTSVFICSSINIHTLYFFHLAVASRPYVKGDA